jgi:hypothetical protein
MNKDPAEFYRLYDRLCELRDKTARFLKEQRLENEKKAGPRIKNNPEWACDDRF